MGTDPAVALLSHSTYGSAKNDDAAKVVEATRIARELAPEIDLDGELQLGRRHRARRRRVEGAGLPCGRTRERAGVPRSGRRQHRLQAGAAPRARRGVRPHHPGIAAPVNDLSRGCTADDIVGVIAITCVQAQAKRAR